jgi:hypothetical protein
MRLCTPFRPCEQDASRRATQIAMVSRTCSTALPPTPNWPRASRPSGCLLVSYFKATTHQRSHGRRTASAFGSPPTNHALVPRNTGSPSTWPVASADRRHGCHRGLSSAPDEAGIAAAASHEMNPGRPPEEALLSTPVGAQGADPRRLSESVPTVKVGLRCDQRASGPHCPATRAPPARRPEGADVRGPHSRVGAGGGVARAR